VLFKFPNSIKYPYQSFAFTSLIDGICTGVNIYSYYLQKALSPEARMCSLNHVDDLCIFSDTLEQHLKDIETVFKDLSKSKFMISIQKAEFFKTEVKYLGHVVSHNKITIENSRKETFKKLEPPKTKKELLRFLGMCTYIGSFIDSFQTLAAPLYNVLTRRLKSNEKFALDPLALKSFNELKIAVDKAPALLSLICRNQFTLM
jgi:Reverse transcriptase (RNA-dependent DNA polymerase).